MYNEAQKLAFIDTISHTSGRNACKSIFRNSEKFEAANGADIGFFSREQLVDFLNSVKLLSLTTSREYISYLGRYRAWCKNDDPFDITKDDIDFEKSIRESFFKNPTDLIHEVKLGLSPDRDPYPAVGLYLAWVGLSADEAAKLTNSQIDLDAGVITNDSGSIIVDKIDEEILVLLREFKDDAYKSLVPVQNTNRFIHKRASKISKINEVTKDSLFRAIGEFKVYIEQLIPESRATYQNVLRSGRLYRLYQAELSGLDISPKNKKIINSILCSKGDIFDNLFQYRKYKEAFGLQ